MSLEGLFLEHLDLIERSAASMARNAGLLPQEIEDFVSEVKYKLIEDDYAILRERRGECSIEIYLKVVIGNCLKDRLNKVLGKFRHSAPAKRHGEAALKLERLLRIDRLDLETSIEILRRNQKVDESAEQLRTVASKFPRSPRRSFVGEEALELQLDQGASAEDRVEAAERREIAARVREVFQAVLEALPAQDFLILKMHYASGRPLSQIAKLLKIDQQSIYPRRAEALKTFLQAFQDEDLGWDDVREVIGWEHLNLETELQTPSSEDVA